MDADTLEVAWRAYRSTRLEENTEPGETAELEVTAELEETTDLEETTGLEDTAKLEYTTKLVETTKPEETTELEETTEPEETSPAEHEVEGGAILTLRALDDRPVLPENTTTAHHAQRVAATRGTAQPGQRPEKLVRGERGGGALVHSRPAACVQRPHDPGHPP